MSTSDPVLRWAARVAAVLAFASAATTAYWALGGTALLSTVGGYAEELAYAGGWFALLVGPLLVAVKIAGGLIALGLARPGLGRGLHRALMLAGGLGGALLTAYGGLFVAVGALVLVGFVEPGGPVDRQALMWHVLVWDLWFLLWGLALAVTTWRSHRSRVMSA